MINGTPNYQVPDVWGTMFNANLQPIDSIPANKWHKESYFQQRARNQYNPYTPTSFSAKNRSALQLSGTSSASGAIGNGTTLNFTTTLTPNAPHTYDMNFAVPYIAIYWGTFGIGALQIWPQLGTIPGTAFTITGGFDWHLFTIGTPGSVIASFSGQITDNNMGNGTVIVVTQWQYLNYNLGTSKQ